MAAWRFNLTRRALLGASVGVPFAAADGALAGPGAGASTPPFGLSLSKPVLSGVEGPCPSCGAVEGKGGLRSFDALRTGEAQPERGWDAERVGDAGRGRDDERPGQSPEELPTASAARWTRTLAAYRRAEARVAMFKAVEARLPAAARAFPACVGLEEEFGRLDSLRLAELRRLFRLPAPHLAALALKLRLAIADQAWELSGCETCLAAMAEDAQRLAANAPA